jgi:hypothetical protein
MSYRLLYSHGFNKSLLPVSLASVCRERGFRAFFLNSNVVKWVLLVSYKPKISAGRGEYMKTASNLGLQLESELCHQRDEIVHVRKAASDLSYLQLAAVKARVSRREG